MSPPLEPATTLIRPQPNQKVLYYQLMNGLYDAVLILDQNGHIVDCNSRVTPVLAYNRDEMWDMPVSDVIRGIDPLPGARAFLDELRSFAQVILLSDTFEQFAAPLMEKLGRPTLFCNTLDVAPDGRIAGYRMRVAQSKLATVRALQSIGFDTIAAGDSHNDLAMIRAGRAGFLFRSTDAIRAANPDLPAFEEYADLLSAIRSALGA